MRSDMTMEELALAYHALVWALRRRTEPDGSVSAATLAELLPPKPRSPLRDLCLPAEHPRDEGSD